mgnify:CR=1 FL=1
MNEKVKAPAIRFKGFSEEWKLHKLNDVSNYVTSSLSVGDAINDAAFELYDANGLIGYTNSNVQQSEYITIIKDGSGVGRVRRLPKNSSFIGTMGAILCKENSDLDYLYSYLETYDFTQHITGATIPHVYYSDYGNSINYFPKIDEQKIIGVFFRKMDNVITFHHRKILKLQNIKKAMLKKMFPKTGSKIPEIRFAGFADAWEQRKVKDACSISTGKSNTQDRIEDGIYPFYVRSPIIERSNRYLYDEEAVLTVGDGVGTGKVFHYVTGKYDLHQRVYRMFDFNSGVSAKYFYYYFSNHFYDRVMAMTAKTSVDSVRYEMISEMDIEFPCEAEQKAITKTFESIDNLITLHQRKLEKLQNIKKACLDKMFV